MTLPLSPGARQASVTLVAANVLRTLARTTPPVVKSAAVSLAKTAAGNQCAGDVNVPRPISSFWLDD